ncbi:hypothetical protein AAU57_08455 [Nonlabens sp. YIK11]|uniref:hypothetical protein n=1 Tax=Nonlabens sp. YIK11 TaxID=1453349 RepID=UPI0006DCB9DE|nr:hypothetical protein [Nonlabens sp. YIK11]KQC33342.1 hypothetical protein AAU57_08455 [Nonlabens sp. YIK11]
MKKIIFVLLISIATAFSAQAQSKKVKEKAQEKVEELNEQLSSISADLALTEVQQKKILDLEIEKIVGQRSVNKEDDLKDDEKKEQKKEVRKEYRKSLNKILTKEQRKALKNNKD